MDWHWQLLETLKLCVIPGRGATHALQHATADAMQEVGMVNVWLPHHQKEIYIHGTMAML
jgi:hypothetical protein